MNKQSKVFIFFDRSMILIFNIFNKMQKGQQRQKQENKMQPYQRDYQFSFEQFAQKKQEKTDKPLKKNFNQQQSVLIGQTLPQKQKKYQLSFQNPSFHPQNFSDLKRQQKEQKSYSIIQEVRQGEKTQYSSSEDDYKQEGEGVPEINQTEVNAQAAKPKRLSFLIKKQDNEAQFIQIDCSIPNVYQSQILLNRNIEDYGPNRANICGNDFIQFQKFKISLEGMKKLKIYPHIVKKKSFRIKITHTNNIFNFGVELRRQIYYLPQHYIWFAKLINARMIQKGIKVGTKPKESKIVYLVGNGIFNQGMIYKCSKYRKKWEKRYILINNEGIFSYRNPKENYTVAIPAGKIQQFWTNFQLYGSNLIVKIKHDNQKTEFAIPILDYCLKEESLNWLFPFYRVLMEHKIHIKV